MDQVWSNPIPSNSTHEKLKLFFVKINLILSIIKAKFMYEFKTHKFCINMFCVVVDFKLLLCAEIWWVI